MQLFFQKFGRGPALFILHGLYGSSDNWVTVARKLAENFTVYLVDQRNHGRSPHDPSHTYSDMANDLDELLESEGLKKIHLAGHSMGGKTAMLFAALHPDKILSLIVIDVAPDGYNPRDGVSVHLASHQRIIRAMRSIDLSQVTGRAEVDTLLAGPIDDQATRQFIMKNLQRNHDGTFTWKLNVPVIGQALDELMGPVNIGTVEAFPVLFIKGERSDYLSGEHLISVNEHFPKAELITIFGAGHWVHADQPERLIQVLKGFPGLASPQG